MRINRSLLSLAFAATCACLPRASGATIDYALSQADAIVVGALTTGTHDSNRLSFAITVDRVLKGMNVPAVVHVDHPWQRKGMFPGP